MLRQNFFEKQLQMKKTRSLPENVLRKTFCGDHSSTSMGYSKLKISNYFFNLLVSSVHSFNLIILSRVMPHTTYRQTDTFVKTVFSDSGGLKT